MEGTQLDNFLVSFTKIVSKTRMNFQPYFLSEWNAEWALF